MKKNIKYITLFLFVIILVLFFSIYKKSDKVVYDNKTDINLKASINNKELDVVFYGGNLIKEKISYGNKIEKIIKISNSYDEVITVALSIKDLSVSNENVTYNLAYSDKMDGKYTSIIENGSLIKNMNLGYNLGIEAKKTVYFKLEIISNNENNITNVEGKLDIVNNLTKKELFIENTKNIIDELQEKINLLKGISNAGYYIYNVDDKLKGFILIDASDISDLKYVLTLYDDTLMVKSLNYKNLNKGKISNIDKSFTSSLNKDTVCKLFTKKDCMDFSSIEENKSGGKEVFYNDAYKVINEVKKLNNNKTTIYNVKTDISNDTNVRGYILVTSNHEYYLYLTNDVYMISGYNLTKYGNFKSDSITIRAYNESAFNLSSKDEKTVCSFSGFNECYNKGGIRV